MGDPGRLIAFEGVEGAGKSTQLELLRRALEGRWGGPPEGRSREVVVTREPGGTPAGERIRALLLDPQLELQPRAEALLFAAARAELVENLIRPALERGAVVLCDRYLDSSLAYQGGARGLGIDEVERINRFATGGLVPDLTFLLEIDPATAAARTGERDRFEDEGFRLQQAVQEAYERVVASDPGRWRRIDAARSPEQVHAEVLAELQGVRA